MRNLQHLARLRHLLLMAATIFGAPAAAQHVISSAAMRPFPAAPGYGPNPLPQFGRAVAFIGDVDGDARADYAVGAALDVLRGVGCSCDQTGSVALKLSASPWAGTMLFGEAAGDKFGASIAGIGDVDGDSIADFAVGSPGNQAQGVNAGAVTVISGATLTVVRTIRGTAGQQFGTRVAALGDINSDGTGELLIYSPQTGLGLPGTVTVVSGADGSVIRTHIGSHSGDMFGAAMCDVRLWDGDSTPDYAIGAPMHANTIFVPGRVVIISGATGALLSTHGGIGHTSRHGADLAFLKRIPSEPTGSLLIGAPGMGRAYVLSKSGGFAHVFNEGGSALATAVAGADDFNGDGWTDLVLGAPLSQSAGRVYVYSGKDYSRIAALGACPNAQLGVSLAADGDFDGDGRADVVAGGVAVNDISSYDESNVLVIGYNGLTDPRTAQVDNSRFGHSVSRTRDFDSDGHPDLLVGAPDEGRVRVLSAVTGEALREWAGPPFGFGRSVSSGGDVDRDGTQDIVVGCAQDDGQSGFLCGAYVFSGSSGQIIHQFSPSGTMLGFGRSVSIAGDIDADGFDDVLIGGSARHSWNGIFNNCEAGEFHAGSVRLYSGATGLLLFSQDDGAFDSGLGYSVAIIDDDNGDGHDDYLIAAPNAQTATSVGAVWLRSGATGAILHEFPTDSILGYFNSDPFGVGVRVLGDVDGDGLKELGMSTWNNNPLQSWGELFVFSGAQGHPLLWKIGDHVDYCGLSFAYTFCDAGDHNGDGADDIWVGIPGETSATGSPAAGTARLLSGVDGSTLRFLERGYSDWDYFGYSMDTIGDIDNDGTLDLAVGAPSDPTNPMDYSTGQGRVEIWRSGRADVAVYCASNANSTGQNGTLRVDGLCDVSVNNMRIRATNFPTAVSTLLFVGSSTAATPFGAGIRCVGGPLLRVPPLRTTSAVGTADWVIDFTSAVGMQLSPGMRWNFQAWHRDSTMGAATTNFSNAIRAMILP